jgi:hypothetical protein
MSKKVSLSLILEALIITPSGFQTMTGILLGSL